MSQSDTSQVGAVVLAAGESRRMGRPKMALAWGATTVIGRVVEVLRDAGIEEIVVVTGGARQEVEEALEGFSVRMVYNPHYRSGEMLSSFQAGLGVFGAEMQASLLALGDQPQVQVRVVKSILSVYQLSRAQLVVPSFKMRRGHPWLVGRPLWPDIQALQPPASLRDFLNQHGEKIRYLPVETSSILVDLDTPEDYLRQRPDQEGEG